MNDKMVCSACGQESCAAGELYCYEYKTASIVPEQLYVRKVDVREVVKARESLRAARARLGTAPEEEERGG